MAQVFVMMETGSGLEKYDIVDVVDDGVVIGKYDNAKPADGGFPFLIVKMPGTRKQLKHLFEPQYSQQLVTPRGDIPTVKLRRYQFNYDNKMSTQDIADILASDIMLLKEVSISDVYDKVK